MNQNFRIRLLVLGVALLLLFGFTPSEKHQTLPSPTLQWVSLAEAQALLKENPKPILVDVYTTWCSWCKVMDSTTFQHPGVVRELNGNFYAVKLLAESYQELEFNGERISKHNLAKKLGVTGYPTFVILNSHLQPISLIEGYRKPRPFLKALMEARDAQ